MEVVLWTGDEEKEDERRWIEWSAVSEWRWRRERGS